MATEAAVETPPNETVAPKPDSTPTPEQLETARKAFVGGFLEKIAGQKETKPPKPETEPAISATPAPETETKPAPAETPPQQDPPDKKKAPPAPEDRVPVVVAKKKEDAPADANEPIDNQAEIDAAVARKMAELGFNDNYKGPQNQPQQPVRRNQTENHLLEVASEMERMNPGKYEGLSGRMEDFWQAEEGYRRKWLKENPGQKWNPKDDEHKDFYETNEPSLQPREFQYAEKIVERKKISEEVRADVMKELEPELQQTRIDKQMARARPVIERAVNESMVSVLSAVPEFEKAMDDGNGSFVLSSETEKAMQLANPALHAIASDESDQVMTVVAELEKMNQLGANYRINERLKVTLPNGATIRPHAVISDTLDELESAISQSSKKDQIFAGKAFITVAERADRIADIHRSNLSADAKRAKIDAIRNGHWTVEAGDIKERIISRSRNRLKEMSKKIGVPAGKVVTSGSPKNGEHKQSAQPAVVPANATSSGGSDTASSSDNVDNRPAALKNNGNNENPFMKTWFGR